MQTRSNKGNSPQTHPELHKDINVNTKLNYIRALVLGANDGIVSIAGLVVGVAGATSSSQTIFTAGMAGIIAGAISMAAGEYVSVSSSRDTEIALLEKEKYELKHFPDQELEELTGIYERKGLSRKTATQVAKELTAHDAYQAHIEAELGIDPDNLTNPWHAAYSSAGAFLAGSSIPLLGVMLPPEQIRIPVTFFSVVLALILTGTASAKISKAPMIRAVIRVVAGGALAMIVTYTIGYFFGVQATI